MKLTLFALTLWTSFSGANPCDRLLSAAAALDLDQSPLEFDLMRMGHLKVLTPLVMDADELRRIFAMRPIFNAPGSYTRERDQGFRRAQNWALEKEYEGAPPEAAVVVPALKHFGLHVGRKLELLLRKKIPRENIYFESMRIRWRSAAISLDDHEVEIDPYAHVDGGSVYLNSVLTLLGDGTIFWNSNEATESNDDFAWTRVKEVFPPSGQTAPGEILVVTGHKRLNALGRPELGTLHVAPPPTSNLDRLAFLFYFDVPE